MNKFEFLEARHDLSKGHSLHDVLPAGLGVIGLPKDVRGSFDPRWATRGLYRSGHNTAKDGNYSAFVTVDPEVPVSPVLVRDLAGRVIHTGLGPESKGLIHWQNYVNEAAEDGVADALERRVMQVVFPQGCRDVPAGTPWLEQVEQVFFTKFRTLEMSFELTTPMSADGVEDEDGDLDDEQVELHAGLFEKANLFPYKLRLDTFYQDGWRLPQTEMLYARSGDEEAWRAGEALRSAWRARPTGEDYAAFIARMGGEEWREKLFEQGCTLIPTFEACNGFAAVGREFEIEDYWPGQAVAGLHEVSEERADKAPGGTILEVLEPGYVTSGTIVPAVVAVSDGSGYVSPNSTDPMPLLPNLDLPHQRTSSVWGATWLPTHPRHFEPPAMWGWDGPTGRFLQLGGPVWDPLHYYYASVDKVVQAYEQPAGSKDHRWLVPVPAEMQHRFYPVVPMMGFDTLSHTEFLRRQQERILPLSGVKQLRDGKERAAIGYHPLPLEFDYEFDPYWAPDLHPLIRDAGVCPELWQERLVGIIAPAVSKAEYLASVDAPESAPWLKDELSVAEPQATPVKNYPFLARYTVPDLEVDEVMTLTQPPYLADPGDQWLLAKAAELWPGIDTAENLEQILPGLGAVLEQQREVGLTNLRFRHLVYRQNVALYTVAWWFGLNSTDMAEMFADDVREAFGERPMMEDVREGEAAGRGAMAPGETPVALVPGESVPR